MKEWGLRANYVLGQEKRRKPGGRDRLTGRRGLMKGKTLKE